MLFSMKTLLIIPNMIAVENTEEPPRLKSGNGIPVNGINPKIVNKLINICLLYTSPSPRDRTRSRMPSSA